MRPARGRAAAALRNLGLAGLALAFSLGLAELVARGLVAPPRYHDAPLEHHPTLGFRGVPHYHETVPDPDGEFSFALNAGGWRGPELPDAGAPAAQPRVAFFGDSFLVARALREEQRLAGGTAALLAERGEAARVYDLSVIDYGTAQQLLLFRQVVERLRPDAVVVAFYTGNDVVNNGFRLAGATRVSPGDGVRPYLRDAERARPVWTHPWRARLRSHSRLFAWVERRSLGLALRPGFAWLRLWPPAATQQERLRAGRPPREDLAVLRPPPPGSAWAEAWDDTLGVLGVFREEVEARGARFLVLVIPMEAQVQTNAKLVALDWAVRRVTGEPLARGLDWNLPERRLAAFFAEHGIESRLLLPELRALSAAGVNPYGRDAHWTAPAHRLAAERVVGWLANEPGGAAAPGLSGEPVSRVPSPGQAPSRLDFRAGARAELLGDGWLGWRAREGWRLGRRGLALLTDAGGDLVARGSLHASRSWPVRASLELAGGTRRELLLAEPGRFELRIPRASAPRAAYAIALVGQSGGVDAELVIHELVVEDERREAP